MAKKGHDLGPAHAIEYFRPEETRSGEEELVLYRHEFEQDIEKRPILRGDRDGKIVVENQTWTHVTDRGIEDKKHNPPVGGALNWGSGQEGEGRLLLENMAVGLMEPPEAYHARNQKSRQVEVGKDAALSGVVVGTIAGIMSYAVNGFVSTNIRRLVIVLNGVAAYGALSLIRDASTRSKNVTEANANAGTWKAFEKAKQAVVLGSSVTLLNEIVGNYNPFPPPGP